MNPPNQRLGKENILHKQYFYTKNLQKYFEPKEPLRCVWLVGFVWMGLDYPWITDVWLDESVGPVKP
jgi:hypothetical protein